MRCPVCSDSLALDDATLRCPALHSFDVARQGYVNLLGRAAPKNADTAEMVAARDRFLSAGHYAPIMAALAERIANAERVLEAGAGTGHYLAAALPSTARGLAADVSVPAARRAARADPRVASVVADTWAGLPVRDATLDAVLCVFAPRNPAEFLRVLRPGGRVVVVVPNTGHLAELRAEHGLLGIEEDKAERVESAFGSAPDVERVTFLTHLDERAATDIVAMGPNAFHGARDVGATNVTIDVSILTFCPTLTG
ncbi:MAG: methyltransferase domain-containing protein [Propionibacterium sp.]|nr:methyltransferase domain-containing protein [Propionibacterium sp.]